MSSLSYYQPRTQHKQHTLRTHDAHKTSLTVSFDMEDVAKNLCIWIIKHCGGSVNSKKLHDWYGRQQYPEALKKWIKQQGGITAIARNSHFLTVTKTRAGDFFIQTPQHAESVAAHEAKVQANPSDQEIEELRSKILHLQEILYFVF